MISQVNEVKNDIFLKLMKLKSYFNKQPLFEMLKFVENNFNRYIKVLNKKRHLLNTHILIKEENKYINEQK